MKDTDTLKQFFTYESIVLMYMVVNLIQYFVSSEFYGDCLITEKIGLLSEMGVSGSDSKRFRQNTLDDS